MSETVATHPSFVEPAPPTHPVEAEVHSLRRSLAQLNQQHDRERQGWEDGLAALGERFIRATDENRILRSTVHEMLRRIEGLRADDRSLIACRYTGEWALAAVNAPPTEIDRQNTQKAPKRAAPCTPSQEKMIGDVLRVLRQTEEASDVFPTCDGTDTCTLLKMGERCLFCRIRAALGIEFHAADQTSQNPNE